MIRFTIPGETRSSKNSKRVVYVKGKPRVIGSKAYMEWAKEAKAYLSKLDVPEFKYPVFIQFHFIRSTRRKFDYINLMQGPLDLMQEVGILVDDDSDHVIPLPPSKEIGPNPGVIVTIEDNE